MEGGRDGCHRAGNHRVDVKGSAKVNGRKYNSGVVNYTAVPMWQQTLLVLKMT